MFSPGTRVIFQWCRNPSTTTNCRHRAPNTSNMLILFVSLVLISSLIPVSIAQTCSMVIQTDKKGKDGDGIPLGGTFATDQSCYDECLGDNACVAASRTDPPGICFVWKNANDIIDNVGTNLAVKQCTSDTTQAPTTQAPTTQTPTCTMDASANTDAANFRVEVSWSSLEACQTACKVIAECERVVFISSTSTCSLYDTAATTSAQSGHSVGIKQVCGGGRCCFETTADQGISATATVSMTSSQSSCDNLCLAVQTCTAAIYSGTSCKLFTSTPTTTSVSGVTLYTKNCPTGASVGSLTYTVACENGASLCSYVTSFIIFLTINIIRFL